MKSESNAGIGNERKVNLKKGYLVQDLHGSKEEDLEKSPGNQKYSELEGSDLASSRNYKGNAGGSEWDREEMMGGGQSHGSFHHIKELWSYL